MDQGGSGIGEFPFSERVDFGLNFSGGVFHPERLEDLLEIPRQINPY